MTRVRAIRNYKFSFCQREFPFSSLFFVILTAFIIVAISIVSAQGAEYRGQLGLALSEEYNDNIFLTQTDRIEDYITTIVPSIRFDYATDFWAWNMRYAYIYAHYAKGSRNNDITYTADLRNHTELIPGYFFVDASEEHSRVSLDVTRDYTNESTFVNQTDRNVITLNPRVILMSNSPVVPTIGYRYVNTWYKDPVAVSSVDNIGYADIAYVLSSRLTLSTSVRFTREVNDVRRFDESDAYASSRYTYGENSHLSFLVGNSWFDFGGGRHVSQLFWNADITKRFTTVTASINAGLSYIPDPLFVLRREDHYGAVIRRETARASVSLSGSMREFRQPETNSVEDRLYEITAGVRYGLTPRSSIGLDQSVEQIKNYEANTRQDVYLGSVRIDHRASECIAMALQYRYSNARYAEISAYNYYNKRVIFEITGRY